jgi:hypothetical protein
VVLWVQRADATDVRIGASSAARRHKLGFAKPS